MKNFMDENFLLQTETAQKLYHEHAAKMPIIDYHCHLIPQMVADDYQFKSLTEIWLGGDHYKWRAMRTNGVDERYCTGKDTTDWEKFEKWAETVPYTFRNPLYHWTHLELKTTFGINKVLNPKTAREIFDECNEKLAKPEYSARGMMRRYHVETVCTTDDPVDSLEYHIKTRESGFEIKMLPTWRPDKAMAVEVPADFRAYMDFFNSSDIFAGESRHNTVYQSSIDTTSFLKPLLEVFTQVPQINILIDGFFQFMAVQENQFARENYQTFALVTIERFITVIQQLGQFARIR
jgi:glucuronate isomerase